MIAFLITYIFVSPYIETQTHFSLLLLSPVFYVYVTWRVIVKSDGDEIEFCYNRLACDVNFNRRDNNADNGACVKRAGSEQFIESR